MNRSQSEKSTNGRVSLASSIAVAGALVVMPLLPWGGGSASAVVESDGGDEHLEPTMLLTPQLANADPQVVRQLCLAFHDHPDVSIRVACASYSCAFGDSAIKAVMWSMTTDPELGVRQAAIRGILHRDDAADIPKIALLYQVDPSLRAQIDRSAAELGLSELQRAVRRSDAKATVVAHRSREQLDPARLLGPKHANANPRLIRKLCLAFHQHPDVNIRRACAAYSGAFGDAAIRSALLTMAKDTDVTVRVGALHAIIDRYDDANIPEIVSIYRADPSVRAAVDRHLAALQMTKLQQALQAP